MREPTLRRAHPDEAAALSAIAWAAKHHWGYPDAWMQRWRTELTVTPDDLARHMTCVAVIDETPVGFSAVLREGDTARLNHLWILPAWMGRGFGSALLQQAEAAAHAAGARHLRITSDPHAELFYARMGATLVGREPASLDGIERSLPIFEKPLTAPAPTP